jgi:N-acetylmuramoyl-L-alanine amidase
MLRWLVLALALLGGARPACAAFINGHSYVPMTDWAEANGLKLLWDQRSGQVRVSNASLRLGFQVNSPVVTVNGVAVRLCYPTANDRGIPLISQLDADKTVRPVLYPPRDRSGRRLTTICLDPGHGGKDTGNRVGSYNEKTYTLALAQELRGQLKSAGFNVFLTRTQDTYVDLPSRPALANRRGADLFVSLHFNATETGRDEVCGPETYCITPVGAASSNSQGEGSNYGRTIANHAELKSLFLAYEAQKSLVRTLGTPDRSVRRARFAVLRDAAMPAILIEGGYMTHPREGPRIFGAGYRRLMARAIVQAVLAYQSIIQPTIATVTVPRVIHSHATHDLHSNNH